MSAETAQTVRRVELPNAEYIFGSTPGMREIREKIDRALHDNLPVLIEGESGTGKEVLGRFLHVHSDRSGGPFLKVNCAAMPANLMEGEMFGYEGDAATGEREGKSGSIGLASDGTLFLDELGDLDLGLQQKLTHAIRSGHYRRVDGREDLRINARFVCATSFDLELALRNKTVLEEMVGCLGHHRLRLLPLRERKEDIPQLCEYLLEKFARSFSQPVPRLSSYVLGVFQQRKWPGNIRELENWMARIVIFGSEEAMGLEFSREQSVRQELLTRRHRATHLKLRRLRKHA
jgi:two-component system, NtrC family, response regulator AtoC